MTDPTPIKDCADCPSYLAPAQAVGVFNRSIGSPMCGTYGYALGKPGANATQDTKLRRTKAASCPKFGEPRTSSPDRNTNVMLPDPDVRDPASIEPAKMAAVNSCGVCKNFVPEAKVREELGWTAGLCAAKGKLLFTNRLSLEARDCEFRQFGQTRGTTGGMHFLPEYSEAFLGGSTSSVATYRAQEAAGFIEPGDWPTDAEVSEEDRTAGIKAWRRFDDPAGSGNSVYFPVWDASFFDDDERELIPKTGSDEHPELYIDHFGGMYALGVAWLELEETPCLWSVPGAGKTELLRYVSWIMQLPFHRINFTADSETDDIIGKMEFSPEEGTYFSYGRLPKVWVKPGVLCLDEPNLPKDPGCWHAIRPLTDNSKQFRIDQNHGEGLNKNRDCYMGMAMNPAWDVKNVGTMEVADADVNRLFHIFIDMPPDELERKIIQHRVELDGWQLSPKQLEALMKTATSIRALGEEEGLPITWAIRPQIKVARALRWFDPITAYNRAVGDFLEPAARQILLDQVRSHWESGS